MKNIFYIIATFAIILLFPACEPIVDEANVGKIVKDVSELKVSIGALYGENGYLNNLQARCESPVLCHWTDGITTTTKIDGEFVFLFSGDQILTLTTLTADGRTLTKEIEIKGVTAPPAPAIYGFLFGYTNSVDAAVKTWTWADTDCFGNGNGSSTGPDWWKLNPEDMGGQAADKGLPADGKGASMKFVLKGKQMIKTSTDAKTYPGKVDFDLTSFKEGWSIGTITFASTNILCGYDFNDAAYAPWSTYNIIYLDDHKMVLGAQEHAPNTNYWYWVFVSE
jgi:hypothetical protein